MHDKMTFRNYQVTIPKDKTEKWKLKEKHKQRTPGWMEGGRGGKKREIETENH